MPSYRAAAGRVLHRACSRGGGLAGGHGLGGGFYNAGTATVTSVVIATNQAVGGNATGTGNGPKAASQTQAVLTARATAADIPAKEWWRRGPAEAILRQARPLSFSGTGTVA